MFLAGLGLMGFTGQESCAIHGSIQALGRNQLVKIEACNESHGFPLIAGSVVLASLSHRVAAMPPGHVRARSRFIEKDQARRVAGLLPVPPSEPCRRHVSMFLFAGPQCFFYNCIPASDKPVNGGDVDTSPQSFFNPVAQLCKRYSLVFQKLAPDLGGLGLQRMTQ